MTRIHHTDDVVYEVSINDHPLLVGEDDDRSDEELIAEVADRTEVADDLDWPEWMVFVSDPPGEEVFRYVNTASRINVLAPYDTDVFEPIKDRVSIEGFDMDDAAMSHWSPTHPDDFDGEIHLDLTG